MKTIFGATLVLAFVALGRVASAQEAVTEAQVAPRPEAPKAAEASPQLVEGAPLGNANVYVHIVEKKPYTNEGRHELVLYPGVAQINGKFTNHYGVAGMYAYHLFENLAVQITPLFNYWNQESGFNQELINKGKKQAQAASALLLQYGGLAGMEVTPMYGKFAFYEGTLGQFTLVLNAGAGMGKTRIELRPEQQSNCGPDTDTPECRAASFGDTGYKFLGSVGAGLRVFLGERAAVRLEVRDIIYTARVDRINGCSYDDIYAIAHGGQPQSGSCAANAFSTTDDRQAAQSLLQETSSDVLNNISFYLGFSFLF